MNMPFQTIADRVAVQYPGYCVQIEDVPESPKTRAIAVYGVEKADVAAVKKMIRDLDWDLCQPEGFAALTRVIDAETTAAFYPTLLPAVKDTFAALVSAMQRRLKNDDLPTDPHWPSSPVYGKTSPANDEFALAA